jgi:uncharacterized protein YggE
MKNKWFVVTGLALLLAVAGLAGCSAGTSFEGAPSIKLSNQQEGIWVSGTGEVSVVPDFATLRLGIEAQEPSVAEAQSNANDAMERVMAALTDSGVAEKDIQTQYFNIQKVTRWDNTKQEEVVLGYRVTNMVIAKIREIDRVVAIIDQAASAGGDLTRIDSIGFSVDDPSAYHEEARQKAIADATAKAEQLADLAGVKLGKPTYISESARVPSPVYDRGVFAEAAGAPAVETPISPGEMEISLSVQLTYAIVD